MIKFDIVKGLDDEKFRRLTGVKRSTFDKMVCILSDAIKSRRSAKGRKKKLTIEDMLPMSLEYIRFALDDFFSEFICRQSCLAFGVFPVI